ncbi:MAG: HAMP domain-containing histidine kinase [Comamonadaceae bacterium]|nr:MAG: HAMP domain-containing histidine kinase [Comamonadaceae bacterium]
MSLPPAPAIATLPITSSPSIMRKVPAMPRSQDPFIGRMKRWLKEEVVTSPLVPVLHPSPLRMKGLGLFTLFGHPLFWFTWAIWLPQPHENLGLRLFTSALGLLLISKRISADPSSKLAGQVFSAVIWFELPFLFNYMYLCNSGNATWLGSMAAMILTYYFVTDWRIATVGLALAAVLARVAFELFGPAVAPIGAGHLMADMMVIAFCVAMGLLLGLSSANLRREHLSHTLTTMGIMAHELRTPLATMSLIGDAIRSEAVTPTLSEGEPRLEKLAVRLHTLVRNMNHQIDTQIANARLLRLPGHKEVVSAASLVREVLRDYPYRNARERDAVVLQVRRDFEFESSHALFSQVIDNLLKNAFRSLAAASTSTQPGDLLVEIGSLQNRGCIYVTDKGMGIDTELQPQIFEPFFSTDKGTGHGLGLAFCQRVIQSAGGTIRVKSAPARGAAFTIELPMVS